MTVVLISIVNLLFLASCGNPTNESMTRLLNRKKEINDSIPLYKYEEDKYLNLTLDEKDSVRKTQLTDSFLFNGLRRAELIDELKAIDFSIDSLQKMK